MVDTQENTPLNTTDFKSSGLSADIVVEPEDIDEMPVLDDEMRAS